MRKVCEFTINNHIYTVFDIEKIEGKKSYVGRTNYDTGEICIEYGDIEDMLLTLKHELMHVWLYENGHKNQDGDEVFNYEDVCELTALSNNSINRITDLYISSKGLTL